MKITSYLFFLLLLCAPLLAQTTTTNLSMTLPAHGAGNWDTQVNGNFNILDGLFASSGKLSIAKGGTGTGSTLTGLLRGSASAFTAAELSGDVSTSGSNVTILGNIPSGVTQAGHILTTNIAAPSSPASGKVKLFTDSTDLRFHDKNSAGTVATTVVADTGASNNFLTAISAAGVISKAQPAFTNISGTLAGAQLPSAISGTTYATATNCANGSSPASCSAAASGAVAVPTGTNPTLVINTTAVTSTSRIFLAIDESLTIPSTTCNTTLTTLVQPVVTSRTAATSFTIQIGAVLAGNPACVSYFIVN